MAARGDEEGGRVAAIREHRHDHGDVGQMRAAAIGRVEHIGVAAADAAAVALPPRASMIVRMLSPIEPRWTGMCGALAIRVPCASNSAQEKSSRSLMLTDEARVLERRAHFLGDRHEQAGEDLQPDRIDCGADARARRARCDAVEDQVADRDRRARASRARRRWSRRGRGSARGRRWRARAAGRRGRAPACRATRPPCRPGRSPAARAGSSRQVDQRRVDRRARRRSPRRRSGRRSAAASLGEAELRDVRGVERGAHRGRRRRGRPRCVWSVWPRRRCTRRSIDVVRRDALRRQRIARASPPARRAPRDRRMVVERRRPSVASRSTRRSASPMP